MSQGWMRVREAAHLMGVSQSTVRRRMDSEELRSRVGRSGRQEVFLPAKLRRELEAKQTTPCAPGHLELGKTDKDDDAASAKPGRGAAKPAGAPACDAVGAGQAGASEDAAQTPTDADLLQRYERLAGGSLILAQQHSDESKKHATRAFEQLAHTRSQLRDVRRVALTGWACCAAAVVFGLLFSITFGVGMSRAQAAADASEAYAEQAEKHAQAQERERDRGLPVEATQAGPSVPVMSVTPAVPEVTTRPMRGRQDPRLAPPADDGQTVSVPTR